FAPRPEPGRSPDPAHRAVAQLGIGRRRRRVGNEPSKGREGTPSPVISHAFAPPKRFFIDRPWNRSRQMPFEPSSLPRWVHAFALLRDRTVTCEDSGRLHSVAEDGSSYEITCAWPGPGGLASLLGDTDLSSHQGQTRLTFLGSPDESAGRELVGRGWSLSDRRVLLA